MEELLENIAGYFSTFSSQYSMFWNPDYYKGLFEKYFSVLGFIVGFIFVLLVYFSNAEEQRKAGTLRVLIIIAVINSCGIVVKFINNSFNQGFGYDESGTMVINSDNIISGFVMTLIISSCYKEFGGRAFLFGVATHMSIPLINYWYLNEIDDLPILHMIVSTVLIGLACMVMSHMIHFFVSWICYFVFHVLIRVSVLFLPLLIEKIGGTTEYAVELNKSGIMEYFSHFYFDAVVFVVILVFAIIFEKFVLTAKQDPFWDWT